MQTNKLSSLITLSIAKGALTESRGPDNIIESLDSAITLCEADITADLLKMNAEVIRYKALLTEIRDMYGDDFITDGVVTDTSRHTWSVLVYENKMSKALWK